MMSEQFGAARGELVGVGQVFLDSRRLGRIRRSASMLGVGLALMLVVIGSSPSADPAELVAKLGSSRYADREAAEAALAGLGRLALPSLRAGRNAVDLEIQTRSIGLLARIESSLLVEPTLVQLDFEETPIDRVIEVINQRSGLTLALSPEDSAIIRERRVTLKAAEPQPFWKAIDALCRAGQLHTIPGAQVPLGQRDGLLLLHDGAPTTAEPVSDSGPFRVHLTSVHYQSEIQLSQPRTQPFNGRPRLFLPPVEPRPASPDAARQFFLQLLVTSEPRLVITQNGLAKVSVAVDDKGQSLLIPSSVATFQQIAGYNGVNPAPNVRLRVDLARPESAGQKIRLIRGTVPIIVATRKSDPLEVSMAGSEDKVFKNEQVALTVQRKTGVKSNGTSMIELSITQVGPPSTAIAFGEGEPLGYRPDTPQQQIEILDAEGNLLSWFPSGTFYNGEETRLVLTLVNQGKAAVPATIRYYSLTRTSTEVPFEFRNLPMP